jgi:hypothetical protein
MTADSPDEFNEDETPKHQPVAEFFEDEVPRPGSQPTSPVSLVEIRPPEWWRELTRAGLAIGLMFLLAAVMLIIVLKKPAGEAKELLGVVLAPLVGLVGAATGFYYGGEKK